MNEIQQHDDFKMMSIEQARIWYHNFSAFAKDILKENLDYGVIPHTSKNTLYKAGAEKLSLVYGLQPEMELTDKQIDLDTGFIIFTYNCKVKTKTGLYRGACEASCNSWEKKYLYGKNGVKRTPEELINQINTIQKMAQKRAFVGAVLLATGASEFFTQDLEDFDTVIEDEQPNQTIKVSNQGKEFDLTLVAMPFGKEPSQKAKELGFEYGRLTKEQSEACGFMWQPKYDDEKGKFVVIAPNKETYEKIKGLKGFIPSNYNNQAKDVEEIDIDQEIEGVVFN